MSLVRLEFGALRSEWYGKSERRLRRAIEQVEGLAPCVVWIDELERALSLHSNDGTGHRMLGALLTWLQERRSDVFIVATANDISKLPAEITRRGRFDAIFFVDLPDATERVEIFQIHLRRQGLEPARFHLQLLTWMSAGYVGAEIESAITEAMFIAYSDPESPGRPITTSDICSALTGLVPLSRSHRETVASLQAWVADGRALHAGSLEGRT